MSWQEGFQKLTALDHKAQAIWWLNGFWEEGASDEAENVWDFAHLCMEIDSGQKVLYGKRVNEITYKSDLDEMNAHIFLERMGETLTVRALRKRLADLDIDNNKRMALSEYLIAKYQKTPDALVNSKQGEGCSPKELAEAQAQLDAAMAAVAEVTEALEAQKALLAQQKKDEAAAKQALEESIAAEARAKEAAVEAAAKAEQAAQAEAELRAAEAELAKAVKEVETQQKIIDDKKAAFQAKIDDETLSGMKRNMARNELAQMESEDPLPLRRAMITQKAALRRAEKARKPFAEATAAAEAEAERAKQAVVEAAAAKARAEAAAAQAEAARLASEKAAAELEQKVAEARARVAECTETLNELKSREGVPHGKIWWMEREMQEMQKFMPRK